MSVPESNMRPLDGADPVHRAVTIARAFAGDHDMAANGAARLAILVEELVMNLFDHAGVVAGDRVELGLLREEAGVRLVLVDPGAPFDPRESPDDGDAKIPDRGGGAGLALVRAWAEIVEYRSAGGVNRLELRLRD
ncbi:hypothetical protein BH10PSE13_BH10PSE13_15000 [soil metagenome]